jgi:hypothetical protein
MLPTSEGRSGGRRSRTPPCASFTATSSTTSICPSTSSRKCFSGGLGRSSLSRPSRATRQCRQASPWPAHLGSAPMNLRIPSWITRAVSASSSKHDPTAPESVQPPPSHRRRRPWPASHAAWRRNMRPRAKRNSPERPGLVKTESSRDIWEDEDLPKRNSTTRFRCGEWGTEGHCFHVRIPGLAIIQLHHGGHLSRGRRSTRCWPTGGFDQTNSRIDCAGSHPFDVHITNSERLAGGSQTDLNERTAGVDSASRGWFVGRARHGHGARRARLFCVLRPPASCPSRERRE